MEFTQPSKQQQFLICLLFENFVMFLNKILKNISFLNISPYPRKQWEVDLENQNRITVKQVAKIKNIHQVRNFFIFYFLLENIFLKS